LFKFVLDLLKLVILDMDFTKIIKFSGGFLLLLLLIFFQLSFIDNLATPWSYCNFIFILIFFTVLLINYQLGFWLTMVSGLFLEIYSPLIFGAIFISLVLTVIIVNFLFNLFFPNRSLYSLLILSAGGTICFHFFNFLYLNLAYWLNFSSLRIIFSKDYFFTISWQLFFTLIILVVVFLLLQLFTKRFKSVFLVEGRR